VTRSKKRGKAARIAGAVQRAHQAMVGWYTRKDVRDKAVKLAQAAGQPAPSMHVGKEPAPVAHFIPMGARAGYCKGHHVLGTECSFV
jgi:hypothetical protein